MLLQYPIIKPNLDSYEVYTTDPEVPLENLKIQKRFNDLDPSDNYYVSLHYSVMAVYFWILGRWDQLEMWDYWPVYVLSIGKC